MKRFISLSLALSLVTSFFVFANEMEASQQDTIHITINDQPVSFDQHPIVTNGRTLIPLRTLSEYLGASVSWDDVTKSITVQNHFDTVQLTTRNETAYINGNPLTLDAPPIIVDGRTFVPVRFLASSLGAEVSWNERSRTVNIKTKTPIQVASIPESNINLYAVKADDHFKDFQLRIDGETLAFPDWRSVSGREPELFLEDINQDGEKELVIILTKGYGTGALDEEVHVFQRNKDNAYDEAFVDHPMNIVSENIKTKLTPKEAELMIGSEKLVINIASLQIDPFNLFEEISLGSSVNFDVVDDSLISTISAYVSPAGYIGSIQIAYVFKDNTYQAGKIEFIVSPELK